MKFNKYDGTGAQEIMLMKQALEEISSVIGIKQPTKTYQCPIGTVTTIDCEDAPEVTFRGIADGQPYAITQLVVTNYKLQTKTVANIIQGYDYKIKDGLLYNSYNNTVTYLGNDFDKINKLSFTLTGPEGREPVNVEVTLYK